VSWSKRAIGLAIAGAVATAAALAVATFAALEPPPERIDPPPGEVFRAEVLDRRGERLAVSYENLWNLHDRLALHEVPLLLRNAFIEAEDRRFFEHGGVDWRARAHALWQNLWAGRVVRGASTISEQVSRMLEPRPRTFWSRWLEGFEAARLEQRFSKGEILAFYLNQVPYARQRRGVAQAARDVFGRDPDTLNAAETLALAVLVRAPSRLDPSRDGARLDQASRRLAARLRQRGLLAEAISEAEWASVARSRLERGKVRLSVEAPHFVRHVRALAGKRAGARIATTLDAGLQSSVQRILDQRVAALRERGVANGAVLVVDHRSDEILAWVNARSPSQIDSILAPRQPGSALKPFVYALALEAGWTAATLIDDAPTSSAIGAGLHRYRNYSRLYRGPLRLREALANSLNVPAVRAMQSLPEGQLYRRLHALGFSSLAGHPDFYGEGLALGNGEVTLHEMVSAYAVLARGGVRIPLRLRLDAPAAASPRRVFSPEVATLIGDVLADADAREAEFGRGGVLDFPVPTAVKTGTSNDYRDAWAVGFSEHYTAGVWMGDLERRAMRGVSGAIGPAMVLRAIFAELHRFVPARPLHLSRRLRRATICAESGALSRSACPAIQEWFRPEHAPRADCPLHGEEARTPEPPATRAATASLVRPSPGLHLAVDPRIPDSLEAFELEVSTDAPPQRVEWLVDGRRVALTGAGTTRWAWPLAQGTHRASARVYFDGPNTPVETARVVFHVR